MTTEAHAHVASCSFVYAPCASQIWVYISDWSFYVTLQNPIILAQKWWAGTHCDFCFEDYLMTKVTRDILLCLYLSVVSSRIIIKTFLGNCHVAVWTALLIVTCTMLPVKICTVSSRNRNALSSAFDCTLVSTEVYQLCICTRIGKYSTCFITIFKPDRQNMYLNWADKKSVQTYFEIRH